MRECEPLVSVIICAFNAEKYLPAALASVRSQTYASLEIIVVDDASTDGTARHVLDVSTEEPRLRLVRRSTNGGLAEARMTGLAEAEGRFVMFLDADDVALPEMVSKQLAPLLADEWAMGVASYAYYIGEQETERLGVQRVGPTSRQSFLELYQAKKLVFLPATTLCRRDLVLKAGGFRTSELPKEGGIRFADYCDDLDLWCRMSDFGHEGRYFLTVPEPLFLYRKTSGSLSAAGVFRMQEKMRWIKDCLIRRRGGNPEVPFGLFRAQRSRLQRLNDLRQDMGAFCYKRFAFALAQRRYMSAGVHLLAVGVLNPGLVAQKLRTQRFT